MATCPTTLGRIELFGRYLLIRHDAYERLPSANPIYGFKDGPITQQGQEHITQVIQHLEEYLPYGINILYSESKRGTTTAEAIRDSFKKTHVMAFQSSEMLCEGNYEAFTPHFIERLLLPMIDDPIAIRYPTLIISHEPNIMRFSSHLSPDPFAQETPYYMDAITQSGLVFHEGNPTT